MVQRWVMSNRGLDFTDAFGYYLCILTGVSPRILILSETATPPLVTMMS